MIPPTTGTRRPTVNAIRLPGHPGDHLAGDLVGHHGAQVRVVHGRGRHRHRGAGELLLLDHGEHPLLAEQAGQDAVADPLVVEVVAAQVRDRGHHPALDQRQPGDVGGHGDRHRHQAADVGQEALRTGEPDVVLDDVLDRRVVVALVLVALLLGHRGGAVERADATDRAVQRLVDEAGSDLRGHQGDLRREATCPTRLAMLMPPAYKPLHGRQRARERTVEATVPIVPVEPPATPVGVPARRLGRRRPGRGGRGPRAGHGAGGLPARAVPDGRRPPGQRGSAEMAWWSPDPRGVLPLDGLRVTRSMRQSARHFEIRVDTAFAEVVAGCADPERHGRLDRRRDRDGVHRAAPARLGPLRRGLARRRARRRAVRRRHRRPLRRRVDVHPCARRLEGRADGAGRPAHRRARRRRLLDTQWQTPHLATLGVVEIPRADVPRLGSSRRSSCPLPPPSR